MTKAKAGTAAKVPRPAIRPGDMLAWGMLEDHRTTQDPLKPHTSPAEEPPDAAEIWGKRIGRILGFAFALYLIYALLTTYVWK